MFQTFLVPLDGSALAERAIRLARAVGQHAGPGGRPGPGAVAAALDRGADVIVMATHGRTGITRALVGSVAGLLCATG